MVPGISASSSSTTPSSASSPSASQESTSENRDSVSQKKRCGNSSISLLGGCPFCPREWEGGGGEGVALPSGGCALGPSFSGLELVLPSRVVVVGHSKQFLDSKRKKKAHLSANSALAGGVRQTTPQEKVSLV